MVLAHRDQDQLSAVSISRVLQGGCDVGGEEKEREFYSFIYSLTRDFSFFTNTVNLPLASSARTGSRSGSIMSSP